MEQTNIIGIDVGGTNIKLGLLSGDEVLFPRTFETRSFRPRDEIIADIVQHVKAIQQDASLEVAGLVLACLPR
jgi:predicted NBD/HSP70 family sugar kinase